MNLNLDPSLMTPALTITLLRWVTVIAGGVAAILVARFDMRGRSMQAGIAAASAMLIISGLQLEKIFTEVCPTLTPENVIYNMAYWAAFYGFSRSVYLNCDD
jgi:hypothetical protein